jgi:hypothetical protein
MITQSSAATGINYPEIYSTSTIPMIYSTSFMKTVKLWTSGKSTNNHSLDSKATTGSIPVPFPSMSKITTSLSGEIATSNTFES